MNIELTQIAESKVRQLGGTVCGVLVRNEAGALAAVSEHGCVTWLDGAVMGPVEKAASTHGEPGWTGKLNDCEFHGDDREACATYSGQVPCDPIRAQDKQGADPVSGDVTTEFNRYKRSVITGARRDEVEVDKTFSFADFHAGYRAGRWSPDRPCTQPASAHGRKQRETD